MMAEPEPEPEQAHCSTLQAEVLVTTLRKIQDTNLENQSLAWQHRKARSQVLAAQRALDHAKAAARGKHGGRTAPTVNQIGLLKRKLADAETTLVNSYSTANSATVHRWSVGHFGDIVTFLLVLYIAVSTRVVSIPALSLHRSGQRRREL